MWIAQVFDIDNYITYSGHLTEREAESAAAERVRTRFDKSVTFEISDEPVLPGQTERTAA